LEDVDFVKKKNSYVKLSWKSHPLRGEGKAMGGGKKGLLSIAEPLFSNFFLPEVEKGGGEGRETRERGGKGE